MAAVVGFLASDEQDLRVTRGPSTFSSTTTAPAPVELYETGVISISDEDLERAKLAVFGGGDPENPEDDEVVLVTVDGTELGRGPLGRLPRNNPDLGVDFEDRGGGVVLSTAPALDDPLPGCGAVHGGGGLRVAVCGPGPETDEIRVVGADGSSRLLIGPAAEVGHWRYALPSRDGRSVLAQWSGKCEVPAVYLVNTRTGQRRPVVTAGVASTGIGWAPDGRAIIGLPVAACGAGFHSPGTYLVDPDDLGRRRRIHDYSEGAPFTGYLTYRANRLERVMSRAHDDLGLEICCNQPSHGGGDAEDGIVFEGHDIQVHAVPHDELPRATPDRPGELRFDCGRARYFLLDYGPEGSTGEAAPDRPRLDRAAKLLVRGLYCTPGPTEFSPAA